MRNLYLLRHAKASSAGASDRDFDRTLESQGREAAAKVGVVLAREKLVNPLFLSSTAVRAKETTEVVLNNLATEHDLNFDSRIYEADLPSLLTILSEIDQARNVVVLVGHNPGLESLLRFLIGEVRSMPAAGLAKIAVSKSWSELQQGDGTLDWLSKG